MKPDVAAKLPFRFFSIYFAGQRRFTGRARGFRHAYGLLAAYLRDNAGWPSLATAGKRVEEFLAADTANIRWGGKVTDAGELFQGDINATGAWAMKDLQYVAPPPLHRYFRLYLVGTRYFPEKHVATVIETSATEAIKRALVVMGAHCILEEKDFCWKDDGAVVGPARVVWHEGPALAMWNAGPARTKYDVVCKADFSHLEERVAAALTPLELGVKVHEEAAAAMAEVNAQGGYDIHTLRAIVEDTTRQEAKRRNYSDMYDKAKVPAYADDPDYEPKPARWEDGKGWINMYMRDAGGVQPGGVYASKADAQYIADKHGNGGRNVAVLISWLPFAQAKGLMKTVTMEELVKVYGTGRQSEDQDWRALSKDSRAYYTQRLMDCVRKHNPNTDGRMHITSDIAYPDKVVISYGGGCWQENRDSLRSWLTSVGIACDTPNDRRSCTRVVWAALRNALRVGG